MISGNPFVPAPVRRPADQVRFAIMDAITSGRLRPGDRLPAELEQARGFQVSRGVVREALRSLAELGLITVVQGRNGGSYVNRLDSAPVERSLKEAMELLMHFDAISVGEMVEARRKLEGLCGEMAAVRRTERELAAMAEALDRASDPALSDDAWLNLDIRFHQTVARAAHNRALIVPLAAIHGAVQPSLNRAILPLLSRPDVNRQHQAMFIAIKCGDAAAAGRAVDRHVNYLEGLYRRAGLLGKTATGGLKGRSRPT